MERCFDIRLSDLTVVGCFRFPDTPRRFGAYCLGESLSREGLRIPAYEYAHWTGRGLEIDAQFEYSCFTAVASDWLSERRKGIMHAVAFRFRDRAYLLCAGPGVGKSTTICTLRELYPGEFSVICGDRPILSLRDDGTVLVEPSPWNGKEGWHGSPAAPLAAVLILERGEESGLALLSEREAALPVYNSWIQTLETEAAIHRFAALSTAVIEAAPVYRFTSGGVPDGARFLYETLFKEADA